VRGHVRRRGNTWAIVIDIGRDESNKRKQRWQSGFTTKREADKALTELLSRVQTGNYVEASKQTVTTFLRDWLKSCKAGIRTSTWATYETLTEKHILPALGSYQLQRLTTAHLNAFYGDLLANGRRHGNGGLSPRTVGHIHGVLRLALGQAVRWQLVTRNVAEYANAPKKQKPQLKTWSADEVRAFLESVRDDRLYADYVLALTTGLRRGELLGLAWRDIDLDAGWLNVRQTIIAVNFKVQASTPKTNAGRRSVALDRATVEVLRNHRLNQLKERYDLGLPAQQPDDYVFSTPTGEALHPGLFTDSFDRRVKAAGVPRIRFHDLRHTSATLALAAGVHPKVVQERLGHASISITLDLYSHSVPSLQEDAAIRLATLMLASEA
jgi:integrase